MDGVGGAYRFRDARLPLGGAPGGGPVARMSYPLMDTRLISLALATPTQLELHEGRDRGLARATLASKGQAEAAGRGAKGHLAPDMWAKVGLARASRRAAFRDFEDFETWRAVVDRAWVAEALHDVEGETDRGRLAALLWAWFFGEFLRLSQHVGKI